MKIATLLQNKHDGAQLCPFTVPGSFNSIVDKAMSSPLSFLMLFYVMWASIGKLWIT